MKNKRNVFKNHVNEVFIETGSYTGDGIFAALEYGFSKIISIEISPKYYSLCCQRFQNHKNVEVIFGDSYKVLPDILKSINCKSTFWLDGHYSCGDTGIGDFWAPLIQELDVIKNHQIKNHTIIIDDMRCWEKPNEKHGFFKDDIFKKLYEINAQYELTYEDGHAPNDILVAYEI